MAQWVKESTCNAGDARDMGSILGMERSPEEENGTPAPLIPRHSSALVLKLPQLGAADRL